VAVQVPTRRQTIETAASALFRERGYAGTSVRDIARALDIRGASLYAHVTSKEDVLWSIVERAATAFEVAADQALASVPRSAGEPAHLEALVRAHVGVITADPELANVFVHEWRHLSGPRRARILARRDAYEARFRRLIARGLSRGTFAHADADVAATFVLTALNGIATWYRPRGRLSRGRIADQFAALTVRALTGETP
jgi:AcrR family transcriptional regulator